MVCEYASRSSWRGWPLLVLPLAGDAASRERAVLPDVAAPAAIFTADGRIEVFVRGQNNELVQRTVRRGSWSGWKNLGGDITAAPAVTSSQPGRLDVFVRGLTGNLVHRYFQNGTLERTPQPRRHDLVGAGGGLHRSGADRGVRARQQPSELLQRSYRNGSWGDWTRVFPFEMASAPAVVSPAPGRIELFVRSDTSRLWQKSYDGSRWSSWRNLGGDLTPDRPSSRPGRTRCTCSCAA